MMDRPDIPPQAYEALAILHAVLGDALLGVWLHGSATGSGLRPHSDVDVLAVIGRTMEPAERRRLVDELMRISGRPGRPGPRPLELIVFRSSDLAPVPFPARSEFVYGEWLRAEFEGGALPEPACDPEMTLVLAQARDTAVPLFGPDAPMLLPAISARNVRRAMDAALPALVAYLSGDERNVLLTLARMWYTAATGEFASKDVAAAWAIARLDAAPARPLAHALQAHLGIVADDWGKRGREVDEAARLLAARVRSTL